ncbi:glycoside hydrolase family 16 protein [soil metagenome]
MLRTRRDLAALAAILTVVLAGAVIVAVQYLRSDRPSWSDEFNGSMSSAPSAKAWSYQTGGSGWGNNELECYTDDRANSALDGNGNLVITARADTRHTCADNSVRDFTSARLSTQGKIVAKYGKVRVRAKLPTNPGIWPAIWALGDNHDTAGWPHSGEIDISEVIGSRPTVTHGSVHGPKADGTPYTLTGTKDLGTAISDDFHVYGLDWSPDTVTLSIDGKSYATFTRAAVQKVGTWVFDHPFYLLLNLAVGGNWPGPPTPATQFPQRMIVDYVRIYD